MIVSRTKDLLDVQMHLDNNLPQPFRPKCKCRLERGIYGISADKLVLAMNVFQQHMGPLKRATTDLVNHKRNKQQYNKNKAVVSVKCLVKR